MPADAFAATALEMLVGGLFLLPFGLAFHGSESLSPADFSTRSILGWVYLVLFGSLVGYTAYVWLLGHAPIGTVATYAYVNPVVAIVLGAVFLHEAVTWTIVAAAAVILVSVAVVIRQEAGKRHRAVRRVAATRRARSDVRRTARVPSCSCTSHR